MLHQNCCSFAKIENGQINNRGEKCGLYYKNLFELIHHIEEEHIPLIDNVKIAERKRLREQFVDDQDQYEKAYNASLNQPVPLSLVCRLKPFPKGHKVHPIAPPKQRTLKFCHYKPKPIVHQQAPVVHNNEIISTNDQIPLSTLSSKRITENQHNRPREESTSSGCVTPDLLNGCQSPGQQLLSGFEERKYRCGFDGCIKTYKNQQGLRQHMRTSHNSSLEHSMLMSSSKLSASEEGILSRQFPGRQSPFLSSSMVFNSPVLSTDSSTSQKITMIQETPILVTTCSVSMPVNVTSVGNTPIRDCKYQCQQCSSTGNEFKVFKTLTSLNKHLREAHGAVTPSRYPPGQNQKLIQIYSPQQSPQRPMSVGSSQQVSLIQPQNNGSFIAPALAISRQSTLQQHSSNSVQQRFSRPSAPIPPSTPPPSPYSSAVTLVSTSPTSYSYSPQKYQNIQQQQNRRQNHLVVVPDNNQDQVMGSAIQHYYTTSNVQTAAIDQQPPVLQPQQQLSGVSQQRFLRYTYQQPDQQQIYSSNETSPAYAYSSSISGIENNAGTTTTIYVTQQQPSQQLGQLQPNYGINQGQVEYEQDGFGRTFYRQQPEIQQYLVEPTGQQQNSGTYPQSSIQLQQSGGTRLIPTTTVTTLRAVPIGGSHPSHQVGMQQFHQTVYGQTRSNVYGESMHQQQPYTNTIRTTPVQSQQQRIYQQNQFYNQQRSQTQGTRRQSPATVAAILAETSP